ncbi:MAG: response regulator transcription factor [Aureispira sp.]|nr:response regulator transcription factor [Aureispira sp.]
MGTIKIGIVEDEVIIAETIISSLLDLGYDTTEPCLTYTQALEMIEEEEPDLILLDIQLAGKKTGIDVAKVLKAEYDIPFIFLTSNADVRTIEEAKKVNPYAYLVKPFNKEDLFTAIEIALSNFNENNNSPKPTTTSSNQQKDTLFVKKKDRFYAIKYSDILFLKSDHVYVEVYTKTETFLVRSSLQRFLEKLPATDFFQSHRRYIINLAHLGSINSDKLFIQEHKIPLSKTYRSELMKIVDFL